MSAIIGIRCDECGRLRTAPDEWTFSDLRSWSAFDEIWTCTEDGDLCPFCAAWRKAREKTEATAD